MRSERVKHCPYVACGLATGPTNITHWSPCLASVCVEGRTWIYQEAHLSASLRTHKSSSSPLGLSAVSSPVGRKMPGPTDQTNPKVHRLEEHLQIRSSTGKSFHSYLNSSQSKSSGTGKTLNYVGMTTRSAAFSGSAALRPWKRWPCALKRWPPPVGREGRKRRRSACPASRSTAWL